jgi:hypothetical protein
VISGLYTAYNGLGFDPYHLWFSAYGRTLIAKLGVGIDLVKEELSAARLRLASAALVYHITIIECTGVAAGSVSRRCIGQKRGQSQDGEQQDDRFHSNIAQSSIARGGIADLGHEPVTVATSDRQNGSKTWA